MAGVVVKTMRIARTEALDSKGEEEGEVVEDTEDLERAMEEMKTLEVAVDEGEGALGGNEEGLGAVMRKMVMKVKVHGQGGLVEAAGEDLGGVGETRMVMKKEGVGLEDVAAEEEDLGGGETGMETMMMGDVAAEEVEDLGGGETGMPMMRMEKDQGALVGVAGVEAEDSPNEGRGMMRTMTTLKVRKVTCDLVAFLHILRTAMLFIKYQYSPLPSFLMLI